VKRAGGRTLGDDANTHANLLVRLRLSLLEMRKIANIVLELVIDVELVRVWIRLLRGAKSVDLVRPDLEVF